MLLFLFAVIVISFSEKKTEFVRCGTVHYGSGTVQNNFLVELGIGLLFPEGKRRSPAARGEDTSPLFLLSLRLHRTVPGNSRIF
jgi:hypothetical protein